MFNQKVEWPHQYGIMAIPGGKAMNQSCNMENQRGIMEKQSENMKNQSCNVEKQSGKTCIQNGIMTIRHKIRFLSI
jgi:hypothetical protein